MKKIPAASVAAMALLAPLTALAQVDTCSQYFSQPGMPTGTCSDFFAEVDTGGPPNLVFDADVGTLSSHVDPVADPFSSLPSNIDTLEAATLIDVSADGSTLTITHRNSAEAAPGADPYLFFVAVAGNATRIEIMVDVPASAGPVPLTAHLEHTSKLRDPAANASDGAVDMNFGFTVVDALGGVIDGFSGSVFYDSAFMSAPSAGGNVDFDTPVPCVGGPECFDISASAETSWTMAEDGTIEINVDTFGSIFSDGFESGDTSKWTSSSPSSTIITLSSANPDVTFNVVPLPAALWLFGGALGVLWSRRRTAQGALRRGRCQTETR